MKKFEKVEKTGFFRAKFLLRCTLSVILGGGALLAPLICYKIPEKPPTNLSNSPSDIYVLCSVIIQQSILLARDSKINYPLICMKIQYPTIKGTAYGFDFIATHAKKSHWLDQKLLTQLANHLLVFF